MHNDLLSVDHVAEILGLHPRTIRRFIRDGRLKAKKLGKQWRIHRRDLDALVGEEAASFGRKSDRIQASTVVDIHVDDAQQADRIFNSMLAAVTAKGPEYGSVHYESLYLRDENKAKLMFWGDAAFIGNALILLHKMLATSDKEIGG